MSPDEKQLVNQLSSMGFPAQRVARAVKNFGCKEREVSLTLNLNWTSCLPLRGAIIVYCKSQESMHKGWVGGYYSHFLKTGASVMLMC